MSLDVDLFFQETLATAVPAPRRREAGGCSAIVTPGNLREKVLGLRMFSSLPCQVERSIDSFERAYFSTPWRIKNSGTEVGKVG